MSNPEMTEKIAALVADFAPYEIELHLTTNPDLPKKYGKAIKAAGGRYSEARGNSNSRRFVHVPSTERELINKLVREFGTYDWAKETDRITAIARFSGSRLGGYFPKRDQVVKLACRIDDPMAAFEVAVAKGILRARQDGDAAGPVTRTEKAEADRLAAENDAQEAAKRTLAARFYAAMPRSTAEFDALVEALTQFTENNGDLDPEDDCPGSPLHGWQAKTAAAQALLDRCVAEICKSVDAAEIAA